MSEPTTQDDTEPKVVNLDQPWTRAYWARRLEVPVERLEEAVRAVGDEPARVAAHLGKPWPMGETGIV